MKMTSLKIFCINDTFEIFKNNYYRFCKNLQKQYLPFTLFIVCNVKCRNFGVFTSLPNLLVHCVSLLTK